VAGLSPINRALNQIPKRAEKREGPQLHETFVDSGVADVLDTVDHQVLNGRRGTGKTHALAFVASERAGRGDLALNIDLRTVGSPDGVLDPASATPPDRAARMLVDLLGQLSEALLNAVLEDEGLIADGRFIEKVDELLAALTNVRVTGDVELAVESERKMAEKSAGSLSVSIGGKPSATLGATAESAAEGRALLRETRRGSERIALNFSDVTRALRELAATLSSRRIWLLLDEWSSVPRDLQPYLAEFLVRCVLPLQRFTVKIAAIEQQASFRMTVDDRVIGIELGADMSASITLDDFMVFEGNEEQARSFFLGLFFKHLTASGYETTAVEGLNEPADVVRLGFTDMRAFDELVRATEGVPRDALYIAARAAMRAGDNSISVPLIRDAARAWFQSDKVRALESRDEARRLLNWIIERVIREKRARAFLVSEKHSSDPLLLALFDARVLHVVRRGYSAQDRPGERYEVWVIDYGAYVDLIQTKYAPQGDLPIGEGDVDVYAGVDVPRQDLRAIRRAILDLDEFYAEAN
jgi:hypothetical protein